MAFLYDQGSSLLFTYLKVIEISLVVSAFTTAWNESQLKSNLPYSKFVNSSKEKFQKVPSRQGMLLAYTPALVISCLLFAATIWLNDEDYSTKLLVLTAAFVVHFLKRVLETPGGGLACFMRNTVNVQHLSHFPGTFSSQDVSHSAPITHDLVFSWYSAGLCFLLLLVVFVHRYSGEMSLGTAILISTAYAWAYVVNLYFAQRASQQLKPPSVNLTWVGVALFCIGTAGNFYHHFLLRGLRKEGTTKYEIPRGGLFEVFVVPHYVFEMVSLTGMFLIAQTVYAACYLVWVIGYLTARSYGTKQWYLQKVDGYPKDRYAVIPYLL